MKNDAKEYDANFISIDNGAIDISEIEENLLKLSFIKECVVIKKKNKIRESNLVAFVVSDKLISKEKFDLNEILPKHMIPNKIIQLSSLPHDKNGFIDLKLLESINLDGHDDKKAKINVHKYKNNKLLNLSIVNPGDLSIFDLNDEPKTLLEAFINSAIKHSEKGITFIDEDGNREFLSYKEILEESEKCLKGLRDLNLKANDKVIFQFNNDKYFVITFWACILGGFIPTPITVPKIFEYKTSESDIIYNVWSTLRKPYIFTNNSIKESLLELYKIYDIDVEKIINVENIKSDIKDKQYCKSSPCDDAILLFTSGSTGNPKGIVQSHNSLLTQVISSVKCYNFASEDISINWMPLEHVGGIIMFHIRDVYLGKNQIQVRTQYVLKDPVVWLDLIDEFKATHSWAPNFAFSLINKEIDNKNIKNWDLSSMKFLINGGEPINPNTAVKFLNSLSKYNLPNNSMVAAWGMAETCSGVIYNNNFLPNDKEEINFVNLGKPIYSMSIRICDLKGNIVKEGVIGNLQVKGDNVFKRYYNNNKATEESFTKDGWFDTGDLGFIKNGLLTLTGRAKEIIIINGVNYNASEIEYFVEQVQGVKPTFAAVCAVRSENSDTDELAIFYNSIFKNDDEIINQIKCIKETIFNKIGIIANYILPLDETKIPKTNIGKIQRTKLSNNFNSGYYDELINSINLILKDNADNISYDLETDTQEGLAKIWCEILNIKNVGLNSNFFELGGHSINATKLISKIYNEFNVKIPLKSVFQNASLKLLANEIDKSLEKDSVNYSIPIIGKKWHYEISSAQQRMYFLSTIEEGKNNYNILGAWEIEGEFNVSLLNKAFNIVINRHDSVRAVFKLIDGEPVQIIKDNVIVPVGIIDLTEVPHEKKDKNIEEIITGEFNVTYDLENGPLIRCTIIKKEENLHILLLGQHHLISDGWSLNIILNELSEIYNGLKERKEVNLKPLKVSITDFINWQNKISHDEDKEYWMNKLTGDLKELNLPFDKNISSSNEYDGKSIEFEIENNLYNKLIKFNRENEVTMFMTLLTAFNLMLSRLTGESDIVIGAPMDGRSYDECKDLVGMFVNSVPIRTSFSLYETFQELLKKVKESTIEAYSHQDYPLNKIVEDLKIDRNLSRAPIFQVMMVYMNMPLKIHINGSSVKQRFVKQGVSQFDLLLNIFDDEKLKINFGYNANLFNESTINRWKNHFIVILNEIINCKDKSLSEINVLTNEEREEILKINDTKAYFPEHKSLQEIFKETSKEFENKVAISFKNEKVTYKELDSKSDAIAKLLIDKGIKCGEIVGILADRSTLTIASIIAIIKAGGAYLPINKKLPDAVIDHMLKETKLKIILGEDEEFFKKFKSYDFINLNNIPFLSDTKFKLPSFLSDLAYIMYTSGSTGKPKGVLISHKNIIKLVKNANFLDFNSENVMIQTTSYTFDPSTLEIWGALLNGMRLHIIDEETLLDVEKLKLEMHKEKVTIMVTSTSLFNQLVDQDGALFNDLKHISVGGDIASFKHMSKVFKNNPKINLFNAYGPTENTAISTVYRICENTCENIPIGKPIANSKAYILDKYNNLQPIGVIGELCVGGDGVAKGYLNPNEALKERFIHSPFEEGDILYKTGDYAKLNEDGNIQYVCRIDNQVKIRGIRIEIEAIINILKANNKINDVCVLVKNDNGNKYLTAYVIKNSKVSKEDLMDYAKENLPDYMMPSKYIFVDSFPLNVNGKIDFSKLKDIEEEKTKKEENLPLTLLEKTILDVFHEALNSKEITVSDSFFDFGGNSLLSIKVVSNLKKMNLKVDPKMLFMNKSARELAKAIDNTAMVSETVKFMGRVLKQRFLRFKKSPKDYLIKLKNGSDYESRIILAPPAGGNILNYIDFAKHFDKSRSVYGLQYPGLFDDETPRYLEYDELVNLFIKSIKGTFRPGKDFIGGYSFGGNLAFGICAELIKQGKAPKGLLILDSLPATKELIENEYITPEEDEKNNILILTGNEGAISQEELKHLSIKEIFEIVINKFEINKRIKRLISDKYLDKFINVYLNSVLMAKKAIIEKTKLDIPIIIFKTQAHSENVIKVFFNWQDYSSKTCEYIDIAGNHASLFKMPYVKELADKVESCINKL